MENVFLNYFLFPHLTLSEQDCRSLSVFLPGLKVFQITSQPSIPEWYRDRFTEQPFIRDPEFLEQIKSCIQSYHAFAEVHGGGGGTMGYLSQVFDDMSDTRFRIQEELRGKCPVNLDQPRLNLLRNAVFLDISRELDEKAQELDSDYDRADRLEKEFRGILGIDDEDAAEVPGDLNISLLSENSSHKYMLSERIRSWFYLFSAEPPDSMPVFVAADHDSVTETLDLIRTALKNEGKGIDVLELTLGSFPKQDQLDEKQFRTLTESPGSPALLASYRKNVDQFLRKAAEAQNPDDLKREAATLVSELEKFCRGYKIEDQVTLRLTLPRGLTLAALETVFGPSPSTTAGQSSPGGNNRDSDTWPVLFLNLDKI